MSKPKPKSAMARLLEKMQSTEFLEGAAVVPSHTLTISEEIVKQTIPSDTWEMKDNSEQRQELVLTRIDPDLCRPWQFADRPEDEMGDIDALANSIKHYGQQEPVLARPLKKPDIIKYEIVFGNRRWRACKKAGVLLLAIINEVTDQEAALFQKEENENRKDLSDLARARSYQSQIDAGIFKSENELSKSLGISRQNLNDLMAFNRIPEVLANTIPNLKNVSRKVAVKLSVLSKDKNNLEILIKLAPKIGSGEITSMNIEYYLQRLTRQNVAFDNKEKFNTQDIVNHEGKKIFTIKKSPNGELIIKISRNITGKYEPQMLKEIIFNYLQECNIH